MSFDAGIRYQRGKAEGWIKSFKDKRKRRKIKYRGRNEIQKKSGYPWSILTIEVIALRQNNWSIDKIARKFCVTRQAVLQYLRKRAPELLGKRKGTITGECEICGSKVNLGHDHDHITGQERGILCTQCNTGLGMFCDLPDLLDLAADYLRKYADRIQA
jgi:hypothetical protein